MRRLRDLVEAHVSDLGGDNAISEAERALVRRAAMLTLQCELMEAKFAQAEGAIALPKQLEQYIKASGALNRLHKALGLRRRMRDVTPDLKTYLHQKARTQRMEAAE